MKSCSVFVVCCIAASLASFAAGKKLTSVSDHQGNRNSSQGTSSRSPGLLNLGCVDLKCYFYDKSTDRNWKEARSFCQSNGLHLASVTSAAQLGFLKRAQFSDANFTGYYWTAGREARELRMLSWDRTGAELDGEFLEVQPTGILPRDYYICLEFNAVSGILYFVNCDYSYLMNVLCEN